MERFATSSPGGRSRRSAVLVGVVAFLTGLAAGGLIPSHGGTHGDSLGPPNATCSGAVAPNGASVPTGPTRTSSGMPAGFARSEDGAVAAAASFVTTGQELLDMDPLAAEQAIRDMAAAATAGDQARDLLTKLAAARTALSHGTGRIVYRQSVLAWSVEAFTPDRARIAIWNVSVLSRDGIAPPQASWAISTFDLVWERDDWHVWSETIAPGPAPILDDSTAPATSAQLDAALRGFTDFGAAR